MIRVAFPGVEAESPRNSGRLMNRRLIPLSAWVAILIVGASAPLLAQELAPPVITDISVQNLTPVVRFSPYPAAEEYVILGADRPDGQFVSKQGGFFSGYIWNGMERGGGSPAFFRLQVNMLSADALLTATVLNRLAYGPSPDELELVQRIGPQAYIDQQIAPETVADTLDASSVLQTPVWQYFAANGSSSSDLLYLGLTSAGEGFIDDIKLVPGVQAEVGTNLVRNGDFELPLTAEDWFIPGNFARSSVTTNVSHSGTRSLRLVATGGAVSYSTSIRQVTELSHFPASRYTLSFWFLATTNAPANVLVRLAGTSVLASSSQFSIVKKLNSGAATLQDLQAWMISQAVRSRRQLLEVLTFFFANHFTTYQPKCAEFMGGKPMATGLSGETAATEFEYRELVRWRDHLMNPDATFYDFLTVSAESPAMLIYLDTVTSTNGAPNENYARELMELFTMGVDNGYDQHDIEEISRAWTGWQIDKLPPGQEENPLAIPVINKLSGAGYWTRVFRSTLHDSARKIIFSGKTVEARFGPPFAGRSYELILPGRLGSGGAQDGSDIISHLADLPYTQEYIIVKLCRLFVHENFVHGTYDYTNPNLSPEAALVRDCMRAWEKPARDGRKGNLRQVLKVIFNSSLFRQHAASRQKVRTPFEFAVSTVRALRATKPEGGFTANSAGTDLLDPLDRLGMLPFMREAPDGWSEYGADWINSSSLIERIRFVQARLQYTNRTLDPTTLLKLKLASSQLSDARAVVDYFLAILFPGEGKANLDLDREMALWMLNTTDDGTAPSPFNLLEPNSLAYDWRVRSTVAYLMGLPRFQEQ
jgi:uncharacterized protein (DUF1800 family)